MLRHPCQECCSGKAGAWGHGSMGQGHLGMGIPGMGTPAPGGGREDFPGGAEI